MTTFDLLIFYKRIGAQILEERLSLRTFLFTTPLWVSLLMDKGSSIVRSFSSNSGQPKNFCWESDISSWWKTWPNHCRFIWQLMENEWMLAASKMCSTRFEGWAEFEPVVAARLCSLLDQQQCQVTNTHPAGISVCPFAVFFRTITQIHRNKDTRD